MDNANTGLQSSMAVRQPLAGMIFCRACGQTIHESAASCPHCGAAQKGAVAQEDTSSWKPMSVGWVITLYIVSFLIMPFFLIAGGIYQWRKGRVTQGIIMICVAIAFSIAEGYFHYEEDFWNGVKQGFEESRSK